MSMTQKYRVLNDEYVEGILFLVKCNRRGIGKISLNYAKG